MIIPPDVENKLAAYRLAAPRAGLRAQVIETALARKKIVRMEHLLSWTVGVLMITLVWAHFQEDRTAQRMARVAGASPNPFIKQARVEEPPVMAALPFHPRMSLPLPEGYTSTRVRISILSLDTAHLALEQGAHSLMSLTATDQAAVKSKP